MTACPQGGVLRRASLTWPLWLKTKRVACCSLPCQSLAGSEIFRFPETPPYDIFIVCWGFGNFGPKSPPKKQRNTGANSVARIPSSFSRGVYCFLGDKGCCPEPTAFWPQKGQSPKTPYFLVFRHPKPSRSHFPVEKAGDQIPLCRGPKKVFLQFPSQSRPHSQ